MKLAASLLVLLAAMHAQVAPAAGVPEFQLVIRNHAFEPAELTVPADAKFKLIVRNDDATAEEFESTDFNRETVVLPHHSVAIYVGPLRPGRYGFFGDFHRDAAQGRLIVR